MGNSKAFLHLNLKKFIKESCIYTMFHKPLDATLSAILGFVYHMTRRDKCLLPNDPRNVASIYRRTGRELADADGFIKAAVSLCWRWEAATCMEPSVMEKVVGFL